MNKIEKISLGLGITIPEDRETVKYKGCGILLITINSDPEKGNSLIWIDEDYSHDLIKECFKEISLNDDDRTKTSMRRSGGFVSKYSRKIITTPEKVDDKHLEVFKNSGRDGLYIHLIKTKVFTPSDGGYITLFLDNVEHVSRNGYTDIVEKYTNEEEFIFFPCPEKAFIDMYANTVNKVYRNETDSYHIGLSGTRKHTSYYCGDGVDFSHILKYIK